MRWTGPHAYNSKINRCCEIFSLNEQHKTFVVSFRDEYLYERKNTVNCMHTD
jgi:hypothetical protein